MHPPTKPRPENSMKIMSKTPLVILTAICIGLLAACNQPAENAAHDHAGHDHAGHNHEATTGSGKLFAEVMAVHDEMMPKLDDVMALKSQAKRKIDQLDSLAKTGGKPETTEKKQKLDSLVAELDRADNAMMDWMHNFDSDMKGMTEARKSEYLESEKVRITAVKEKMLGGIAKATAQLK